MEPAWYMSCFPCDERFKLNKPLQDIARSMAEGCLAKKQSARREVKFYTLARNKAQAHTGSGGGIERNAE